MRARTDSACGTFCESRQIRKMISSYVGENKLFEQQYLAGELELEFNPQGTLAERIRAGGAGIPAFYTRTGVGTVVADGKPQEEFDGQTLCSRDLASGRPRHHQGVASGHCRATSSSARLPATSTRSWPRPPRRPSSKSKSWSKLGSIDPDCVHTPGIYVHRIVRSTINEKRIEKLTVRLARGERPLMLRRMAWSRRCCSALAEPAEAGREPVLKQVDLPHSYYWRELYIPQLTTGPSSVSFTPDGDALIYSMGGSLWRQAIGSDEAIELTHATRRL